jgi:hypothetical protein
VCGPGSGDRICSDPPPTPPFHQLKFPKFGKISNRIWQRLGDGSQTTIGRVFIPIDRRDLANTLFMQYLFFMASTKNCSGATVCSDKKGHSQEKVY